MTRTGGRSASAPQTGAARHTVAWNGLRLRVPEGWEPARLGRDYLGLESPRGPALEARFVRGAGRLAPDEVVRRMLAKSAASVEMGDGTVPAHWLSALSGRDNAGFACGGTPPSRGVVTLCRDCGMLAAIRFFPAGEGPGGTVAREVLASLRDHGRGHAAFDLYGIRLSAPPDMGLARFSFKPGRFDLEFSGPGRTLGFSRFAPADVLLAGGDLCAFAGRHLALPGMRLSFEPFSWRGQEAALAVTPASGGPVDLVVGGILRVLRRRRQARVMVWRVAAANKLAAVAWCGVTAPDAAAFDTVCGGYGIF